MTVSDGTAEQIAHFEKLGEPTVRMYLETARFPLSVQTIAVAWLAKRDEAAAQAMKTAQAEQTDIARSAKDASWVSAKAAERSATAAEKANLRATIALVIAAISIAMTVISLVMARR